MYQIISRIDNKNFDYNFITGHDKFSNEDFETSKIYETSSISVPFQKRYKMSVPIFDRKKLNKQLKSINPQVIHIATPSLLGSWAVKFANNNNIPVITIFHTYFSSYVQYYFKWFPWLAKKVIKYSNRFQKKFYNKCNIVLVPALSMKTELINIGVDELKIKVWERGINRALFNPDNNNKSYLPKIFRNDKKNILFVSRLVWEKNLSDLIKVYKAFELDGHPYNFIIAGSGHAEKEVRKAMPKAYFTGNLSHEELNKLYASADLLFFPSISETFGNVVLEGLSSGTPAIVANKGGTRDMIQNGYNGYICEHQNIDDYKNKINMLLKSEDKLKEMSSNARDSSSKYNWDELTDRYFDLVKSLIKA